MLEKGKTLIFERDPNDRRYSAVAQKRSSCFDRKRLTARDHEILRLYVIGVPVKAIARRLGLTSMTISNVVHSAKGREHLALLGASRDQASLDIRKALDEDAPKYYEKMRDIMLEGEYDNPLLPPATFMKEARELLGLAGYVKPQKLQVSGAMAVLTSEDFAEIRRRAELAANECGFQLSPPRSADQIIDMDFEELLGSSSETKESLLIGDGDLVSQASAVAAESDASGGCGVKVGTE